MSSWGTPDGVALDVDRDLPGVSIPVGLPGVGIPDCRGLPGVEDMLFSRESKPNAS